MPTNWHITLFISEKLLEDVQNLPFMVRNVACCVDTEYTQNFTFVILCCMQWIGQNICTCTYVSVSNVIKKYIFHSRLIPLSIWLLIQCGYSLSLPISYNMGRERRWTNWIKPAFYIGFERRLIFSQFFQSAAITVAQNTLKHLLPRNYFIFTSWMVAQCRINIM